MSLARYQCLSCDLEWQQPLGCSVGWTPEGLFIQPDAPPTGCPSCGHPYMKWLNYGASA
jgi:rubrerythrin